MARPRFSIVTPVYNTRRRHLEECLTSVLSQTFTDWELCVVDDKSPKESIRRTLRRAAGLDGRIRIKFRDTNGGIVAASNDGLSMATGDFVVLLDHDDVLEPDALELVNNLLDSDELIDYVYTDESLITEDGRVLERFYKPDWSPERFRHQMYVCHLSVIRRTLMADVGGFREGFDGAQDYDLMFRVTESARRIGHVPHLLYHWRMAKTSVANNASAKPYAYEAGKRAIEAHVNRIGLEAEVENVEKYPGNYRLVRRATTDISARLFVSAADWNVEVWGGANKSRASATRQLAKLAGIEIPIELVTEYQPFLPEVNRLAQTTQDDVIFVAGSMVEPISPDWAIELLSPFDDPQIGVVSGVTYTPNSLVDHAGYFLNGSYLESNCFRLGIADRGQRAILETKFEMSAVESRCMAIRRDLFQRLEGFDESLAPTWAAVDLCLRARALGYEIIVNPWVKFFDFSNNDDFDRARVRVPKSFREKWRDAFASDPYRPRYPMRMSDESRRPHWQPVRFREFRKTSRK